MENINDRLNELLGNIAATFQYYDERGRRLACFCRFLNESEAEIYVLSCSRDDQFVKRFARQVYRTYLDTGKSTYADKNTIMREAKPFITTVAIVPEERELQTLIRYCKKNFYFYIPTLLTVEGMALVNSSDILN